MSAESTARVSLRAPLTGVMVPIEDVPDPVFARKMVGDGFSVDPLEGRLTSPVPGEVMKIISMKSDLPEVILEENFT